MRKWLTLLGAAVFWVVLTTLWGEVARLLPPGLLTWLGGMAVGALGFGVFVRLFWKTKQTQDNTSLAYVEEAESVEEFEPVEVATDLASNSADSSEFVQGQKTSDDLPEGGLPEVVPSPNTSDPDTQSLGEEWSTTIKEFFSTLRGLLAQPTIPGYEDLKQNAEFIRENVVRAYEISDNLAGTAQQAFSLSEQVQNGVKVVTDALNESMRQSEVLFEQSKKIVTILEMMSDVSEKIHVLSINASIVSARTGTLGRGFDVVAKEIRSLAKETEHSLKNIEEVIGDLQRTINDVIRVVKNADAETEQEKNSLITVAGSLQGVILGVEIIRAVSAVVKDKAEEETVLVQKLSQDLLIESNWKSHLEEWEVRFEALSSKSLSIKE